MKLLAKVRKRIDKGQKESIKRSLLAPGKILVKKGEKVKAEDIVAEGTLTSGFRSLPLAEILGVEAKQAVRFILKKEGERVYPGEVIAQRRRFFGLSKKVVTSPIEGIFGGYDSQSGILRLEFLPQIQRLVATCEGEVEDVPDRKTVVISCSASKIYGVCGSGRIREGVLKVVAKSDDFLLPSAIDESSAGKIIAGGALITREALAKALTLGVGGIIAGGIGARDFFEIGGASSSYYWTSSDIGLTIVLTEGFGRRNISEEMFALLEKFNDRYILIDGDQAVVTIPNASDGQKSKSEKEQLNLEQEIRLGARVRIIDYDYLGLEGTVKSIDSKISTILGGLKTYMVEVETRRGLFKVPYQNIEILI